LFENYGRVKLHTEEISKIIALTAQDKKNKGKEIRFSLLTGLGDCGYDIPVSASEMKKAIQYYLN
jgi:3-dehydroquinate synthase